MMEEDFIMRQIKLVGEGIAVLLKKDISQDTLGEIQREDGSFTSRYDLVLDYLNEGRINEAFLLINSLKYKMSYYDFEQTSSWFCQLLREYQTRNPEQLTEKTYLSYKEKLNDLL